MSAELAIEWIEALANNDFKQARGQMSTTFRGDDFTTDEDWNKRVSCTDGFCCLGVLRYLNGDTESTKEQWDGSLDPHISAIELDPEEALALGIRSMHTLIELNDGQELSFPEIAKRILANPERFFVPKIADEIVEHFWTQS